MASSRMLSSILLYKSAIDDRLSVFEEQVIQIADDMSRDFKTVIKNSQEKRIPDSEASRPGQAPY